MSVGKLRPAQDAGQRCFTPGPSMGDLRSYSRRGGVEAGRYPRGASFPRERQGTDRPAGPHESARWLAEVGVGALVWSWPASPQRAPATPDTSAPRPRPWPTGLALPEPPAAGGGPRAGFLSQASPVLPLAFQSGDCRQVSSPLCTSVFFQLRNGGAVCASQAKRSEAKACHKARFGAPVTPCSHGPGMKKQKRPWVRGRGGGGAPSVTPEVGGACEWGTAPGGGGEVGRRRG